MVEHEAFTAEVWERVYKKLELYACRIAGVPYSLDPTAPIEYVIGDAVSPIELASEIMKQYLSGRIKPDLQKDLTERYLLNLLKRAARKRFYSLLRRIEIRKTDYAEEIRLSSRDGDEDGDFFDSYRAEKVDGLKRHQMLSDPLPSPDVSDKRAAYLEGLRSIYDQVKGDRELEEMVKAICEDDTLRWPKDIAAYLKTSVENIYNREKRLRRRFEHLLPQKRKRVV